MEKTMSEQEAKKLLESGYVKAEEMLNDDDKIERFLQRLEKKLKGFPVAGKKLANVPVFASLVKSYVKKEYTDIPIGSVIAIVSALIYFASPIDLIPDSIPFVGYVDDAAVIAFCWNMVESDVAEYIKWRENNEKIIKDL